VSGAISPGEVKGILSEVGFQHIVITPKTQSEEIIREWHVAEGAENVVFSAYIRATKPKAKEMQTRLG
jgi:N-acetylglutamate synthase-like GNAT family acetyltransferase